MKKAAGILLSIIFIVSLAGSAWSLVYSPGAEGFAPSDFNVPEAISVRRGNFEPPYIGTVQSSPDLSIQFSVGAMYEDYGGALSVTVVNGGYRDVFLTAYRFEWVESGDVFEKYVYMSIGGGETADAGIIGIEGPPDSGVREYRMYVKLLQDRGGSYYKYMNGNDDWIPFEIGTIDVNPLGSEIDYDYVVNSELYFNRANELVTIDSPQVANAVTQSSAYRIYPESPAYNYDKLCAIFDYVSETIDYTSEPEGEDIWKEPEESLSTGTGDCEDFSLLIATMVHQVGGTPRLFLIDGHAFAGVFIGNTSRELADARDSIMAYYGTELNIHTIDDEKGYWLIADPLGSFYLGGLSVSASPTEYNEGWDWSFDDTPVLHAVDITGETYSPNIFLRPVFWMSLMIITGIILILLILALSADSHVVEDCTACGEPIEQNGAKCQYCGLQLHEACSEGVIYCLRCGNLFRPLPPPPVH